MQTPINPPSIRPIPGTPLRNNWLFEPSIYDLKPYHRILNEIFCVPREIVFSVGWDKELFDAIKQAHKAGYTTITIEYSPCFLDNYADMLQIVEYDQFLEENKNDIEDIKYDLLAQTNGEIQIENCITKLDKIIDILDMFYQFNTKVRIYF